MDTKLSFLYLSEPDMISCVQQSIDRGWYKLVPPKTEISNVSNFEQFDKTTLTSGSYTQEDIDAIKKRAEELNKDGGKGTF